MPRGEAAVGALSGTVRRPGGTSLVLAALAALICALYFWTAYTSGPGTVYYELLTDAFLDGNSYVAVEPEPELLALPDPYDPAQNAPYRFHDASLYEGRYYLYFGPTPVFLLHLPLRAVGVHPSDPLATSLFASGGFLFALALMLFLVRRYRPATGLPTRVAATLLLGLANVAPFLLRRPAVYEVAIAAGYLCLMAGLYLTLTAVLRERPSLARLAGGSAALGLAVGARPHLILALPVWIWAWTRLWRSRERSRAGVRLAAAALIPLGVCLALLGVYNLVRFGSFTELGTSYQLTGAGVNPQKLDRFSLDRLAPGVFFYLLGPPRLDTVFPFAHLIPDYPGMLSPQYAAGLEAVSGALATTPILVLAVAAPVLLLARGGFAREQTVLAGVLLPCALLVVAAPILSFDGATMRYEVDFVSLLLLSALLVGLRLQDELRGALVRRIAAAVAACATVVAVLFALAFSVSGYADALRKFHPDQYQALEKVFTLGTAPDDGPG